MGSKAKLFTGLSFSLDEDVNDEIRVFIESEGGCLWSEEESPLSCYKSNCVLLVNQRYLRENKSNLDKSRFYRVVLHQWVNVCVIRKTRVDMLPFLISMPEQELANKRLQLVQENHDQADVETVTDENTSRNRYTKDEEDIMWEFSLEHDDLSQQALWALAEQQKLLHGRTARAMLLHFTDLKHRRNPLDRTNRHYTQVDDDDILTWAYCWHTHGPKDKTKKNIWRTAQENNLIDGRNETQMHSRYKKLCLKNVLWKERASRLVTNQRWLSEFNSFE